MTTKEQIVAEARRVFERYGYNKTSLGDIAYAAQKGRRTIYSYFSNKEDVFKAVIEEEIDMVVKTMRDFIESPIHADEKLRMYMHLRMDAVKRLTVYYDAIRRDLIENLAVIEKIRKRYDEMETGMIKQMLDEGNQQNIFEVPDTEMVAAAIVLAIKGFELPFILGTYQFDHDRLIDPLIMLFYRGIIKG